MGSGAGSLKEPFGETSFPFHLIGKKTPSEQPSEAGGEARARLSWWFLILRLGKHRFAVRQFGENILIGE